MNSDSAKKRENSNNQIEKIIVNILKFIMKNFRNSNLVQKSARRKKSHVPVIAHLQKQEKKNKGMIANCWE